jgi:SAM-dependent methyltransferase
LPRSFWANIFPLHHLSGRFILSIGICLSNRVEPSFQDVLNQQQQENPTDERRLFCEKAAKLAVMQAKKIVTCTTDALQLLANEPCNSFHLYDDDETPRGSMMYPQASFINHSCFPNCSTVSRGRWLDIVALKDIVAGAELTNCYLGSFEDGAKATLQPWVFLCDCPRCEGVVEQPVLLEFDKQHRCLCGKITTSKKVCVSKERGKCQCHAHNTTTQPLLSLASTGSEINGDNADDGVNISSSGRDGSSGCGTIGSIFLGLEIAATAGSPDHIGEVSIEATEATTTAKETTEATNVNEEPGYREDRSNYKSVHNLVTYSAADRDNVDPADASGIDGTAINLALFSTRHDPSRLGHDLNCTGLSLWFGSENMCDYLLRMGPGKLKGRTVLELGCGVGLAGICASKIVGQAGKVVLTDIDTEVLALVEQNISKNADGAVDAPSTTCRLPFGDREAEAELLQSVGLESIKFDVVMAADVIYEGDGWQIKPLMDSVSRLLAPGGIFALAFTKRLVGEELIFEQAEKFGLKWTIAYYFN